VLLTQLDERARVEGLQDMPVGLRAFCRVEGILIRSTDHHPDLTELGICLDLITDFIPALAGHLVIDQHEVRAQLTGHFNGSATFLRQKKLYVLFGKGYLECPAHGPTVVRNQDFLTH
jgi:hypothetical protein